MPCRGRHRAEVSQQVRSSERSNALRQVSKSVFKTMEPIWHARESIARLAFDTGSWQKTTQRLMQIPGYGGTGFLAKEVVQDLLHTPVFQDYDPDEDRWKSVCVDENDWCAVGPGARRGLNRLKGRPVNHGVTDYTPTQEQAFLKELKDLWESRKKYWKEELLGERVQDLTLHDVQFQLCEFDKYLRAKYREGRVREYKPPTSRRLTREEMEVLVWNMEQGRTVLSRSQ